MGRKNIAVLSSINLTKFSPPLGRADSGKVAERTKFLSYCIYSAVISALIYPIEAHWIWGGGWLSQTGSHDFADSCAIHMVGGICALSGAKILGPRIGKFVKDRDKIPVETVVEAARKALYTGHIGDGKIFVYNMGRVIKIRTGEED